MHLELGYVNQLSGSLQLFKRVERNVFNFRCPLCGDSSRDKNKTRGYIYQSKGRLKFKCHNCQACLSFQSFLKRVSPFLYGEYRLEKLKEMGQGSSKKADDFVYESKPVTFKKAEPSILDSLIRCDKLPPSHDAYRYLQGRDLPRDKWHLVYYTDNFCKWINDNVIYDKFKHLRDLDPRVVLPSFDATGKPFMYSGRALDENASQRYIIIKPDDEDEKVYGLERVDPRRRVYVVEGQFDSLYLDNAIAVAGASMKTKYDDMVYVWDNDRRNRDVCKAMERAINSGFSVCIWPESVPSGYDINDIYQSGEYEINALIDANTFSGLRAKAKFIQWKKV